MPVNTQLVALTEATRSGATLTRVPGSRKWRAKIIAPGAGSSGVYLPEVLQRDAGVFSAGLHSYINHPTITEAADRPERSVMDLAGKLTTTAVYDGDGLYAEIEFFPHIAPIIEAMAGDIGLSIRASGTVEYRDVNGRSVPYVTALTEATSVDVVTRAGAGGKLVQLLESARPKTIQEARNVGQWIESRLHLALTELGDNMFGDGKLTRAERIALSSAVGDALGAFVAKVEADAPDLYQRDLWDEPPNPDYPDPDAGAGEPPGDASMAVSEAASVPLPPGLSVALPLYDGNGHEQRDPLRIDAAQLREAVHRALVPNTITPGYVYTPPKNVTAGAPPPAPTPTLEESMETKQTGAPAPVGAAGQAEVTEAATPADPQIAVLKERLAESQARESALSEAQQQKKLAEARADQAVAETRSLRANDTARSVIAAKLTESAIDHQVRPLFLPRVNAAVLGRVPLTEAGEVDGDKLDAVVIAAIEAERVYAAQILEAAGLGSVAGLGSHSAGRVVSDADVTAGLTSVFESIGMSGKTAELAAKGRF